MEEIKVIFKRPISKEQKEKCFKKLEEFTNLANKFCEKVENGQCNPFDIMVLLALKSQEEQIAKMWGFNSSEDMLKFLEYFGAAKLNECD